MTQATTASAKAKIIKELTAKVALRDRQLSVCAEAAWQPVDTRNELIPELSMESQEWTESYRCVLQLSKDHLRMRQEQEKANLRFNQKSHEYAFLDKQHRQATRQLNLLRRGATLVRDALNLLLEAPGNASILPLVAAGVGAMAAMLGGGILS